MQAKKSINTTELEYLPVGEVQVNILTTCETKADSRAKHFALEGEAV